MNKYSIPFNDAKWIFTWTGVAGPSHPGAWPHAASSRPHPICPHPGVTQIRPVREHPDAIGWLPWQRSQRNELRQPDRRSSHLVQPDDKALWRRCWEDAKRKLPGGQRSAAQQQHPPSSAGLEPPLADFQQPCVQSSIRQKCQPCQSDHPSPHAGCQRQSLGAQPDRSPQDRSPTPRQPPVAPHTLPQRGPQPGLQRELFRNLLQPQLHHKQLLQNVTRQRPSTAAVSTPQQPEPDDFLRCGYNQHSALQYLKAEKRHSNSGQ